MSAPNDPTPAPLPPESADTMRLAPDAPPVSEPAFSFLASSSPLRQVIGDFEIVGKLGQGGMGAVYRARQVSLGRLAASAFAKSVCRTHRRTGWSAPDRHGHRC